MGREAVTRVERLHRRRVQEAEPERLYTQREVDNLIAPYRAARERARAIADALDRLASNVGTVKLFAQLADALRECASILRR